MIVQPCSDYLHDLSFVVIGGLLAVRSGWATSRFTRNGERDRWQWERRAEFMEQTIAQHRLPSSQSNTSSAATEINPSSEVQNGQCWQEGSGN
jgi:hypothetical protein